MRMTLTKKMAEKHGFVLTINKSENEVMLTIETTIGNVLDDSFQENWELTDGETDDIRDLVVTRAFGMRVSRMFE